MAPAQSAKRGRRRDSRLPFAQKNSLFKGPVELATVRVASGNPGKVRARAQVIWRKRVRKNRKVGWILIVLPGFASYRS